MTSIVSDGFAIYNQVFGLDEVKALTEKLPSLDSAAGTRALLLEPWCQELAQDSRIRQLVETSIGPKARAVRGILFDKTANTNWNLGWHQDKKIAVMARREADGYSAWSEKEGVVHCQPPAEVLEQDLAVRIHLDPCGDNNGPLLVLPGSHKFGLVSDFDAANFGEPYECLADVGDVLLMKPLLLHASGKALSPAHRRVIHIEYSAAELADGLEWAY